MDKSFNIIVEETKNNVINALTESKLPATVSQMILREILQGVEIQTQQILKQEKEQYQKAIQEENKPTQNKKKEGK